MSQHIHDLMGESMKGLRDLVDVDCIVGKPIVTASGTTIIPISKVTFGFGSGGSDIAKSAKDDFGGGGSYHSAALLSGRAGRRRSYFECQPEPHHSRRNGKYAS